MKQNHFVPEPWLIKTATPILVKINSSSKLMCRALTFKKVSMRGECLKHYGRVVRIKWQYHSNTKSQETGGSELCSSVTSPLSQAFLILCRVIFMGDCLLGLQAYSGMTQKHEKVQQKKKRISFPAMISSVRSFQKYC